MVQLNHPPIHHNIREGHEVAHRMEKEALNLPRDHPLSACPPLYVINKLETDREVLVYFVKKLSTNVCNMLSTLGNLNVFGTSTIFYNAMDKYNFILALAYEVLD